MGELVAETLVGEVEKDDTVAETVDSSAGVAAE